MPVETAVTRFVIVLVVSWIALNIVAELAFPVSDPLQLGLPEGAPTRPTRQDDVELLDEDHPRPVPPTSMPNP